MSAKLVANVKEIVAQLQPFFPGKIHFRSEKGDYNCALCGLNVKDTDAAALSYGASHYGTWAHQACIKKAAAGLSGDSQLKEQMKKAALKRDQKVKKVERAQSKDNSQPVADTTSAVEIEAKYEALMSQAIEAIQSLQLRLAGVQAENDQLKSHLKAITERLVTAS